MQQELSIEECFRILELEPGSSLSDVNESWRTLSQIWHPDKHVPGTKAHSLAEQRQLLINYAHDTLKTYLTGAKNNGAIAIGQNLESQYLQAIALAARVPFMANSLKSQYPRMSRAEFDACLRSANSGSVDAQFKVGLAFELGFTGPVDARAAAHWYERASRLGHAGSTHRLGFLYLYGIGVPVDVQRGIKLWKCAAVQGSLEAQMDLGLAYEVGAPVRADLSESKKWYAMANKSGESGQRKVVDISASRNYQPA